MFDDDPMLVAGDAAGMKVMQVLFLGGQLSRRQKLCLLVYPLLKLQVTRNA
jgi:hypothetical protein